MTPEEREAERRRQQSALGLGAPSPTPSFATAEFDEPVDPSSIPEMTSPETHQRNADYRSSQNLSRGLGLLAGAGTMALGLGAKLSGNSGAIPWIAAGGQAAGAAAGATGAWAREDRAFEDAERDRQAADAAAKKEAARKENEAAWERFLGEEKVRQGRQGLAIREQDLAQDRAWRQEQHTLGSRQDARQQAEFAYAEARRDPTSEESRAMQGFVRAARDSITASGRNPGMGEQLTDEVIDSLSAEQIEKNDVFKRLADSGMQMPRGRRGGAGGAGAGAPPAQGADPQFEALLLRMAEEKAALNNTTVEYELSTLKQQQAIADRTTGGMTQFVNYVNRHFATREGTNLRTDQDELEAERESAILGWDRVPNAPQLNANTLKELNATNEAADKSIPKLERLAEIYPQLNFVDHAAPSGDGLTGAVGTLMVAAAGNTKLRNEAIQLTNEINALLRDIQHMGVPQQFEMTYTERGIPKPDSFRGGMEGKLAAENLITWLERDRNAAMSHYGYRRAESGRGGNPQSRQVAPTQRINRTRTSARRADATQAPATPPPETNMSPPSGGGTVRVMFEGEELEIPAEDLQDALRDGATQL